MSCEQAAPKGSPKASPKEAAKAKPAIDEDPCSEEAGYAGSTFGQSCNSERSHA